MARYIVTAIAFLLLVIPYVGYAQMPPDRIKISSAPQPAAPILTNVGSPGNNGAHYGIVCHYADGGISQPSNFSFTNKVPSNPNNTNNIQLSGWTCASVDILKGNANTAIALGITTSTYNDTGAPLFPYSPTSGLPDIQVIGPLTFTNLTSYPPATITNSGNFTIDTSQSGYIIANLTGNSNMILGNLTNGESFTVDAVEQAPGNYTIAFAAPTGYSLIWSAANTPTFSTTSGSHNVVPFHVLGNTIIGGLLGNVGGAVSGCGGNISTNCTQVLATSLSSPLPVNQGGTGTLVPGDSAGTGLLVTGTWPNETISLQTPITVANGGTGTSSVLTGIVRGGSPITASELSGDVTTSGSNATTVVSTHLSAGLPVNQGGTGHVSASIATANAIGALAINSNLSDLNNASTARTNLGLGALATASSPLSVGNGGTGTASTLTGIMRGGSPVTASELSGDVTTSGSNVTTVVSTHLSSPLPVAQGGTGTATPSLVQGTNITISGTWPNQTINSTASGGGSTYATLVNTSGTTVTATCSAISGTHPSRDMIWQVLTGNLTYTTPAAGTCIEGDIIEAYFIQGNSASYTVTAAAGSGITLISPTLYTVPTGTSPGYFLHLAYEYHANNAQWELLYQNTYPITAVTVAQGGTGATAAGATAANNIGALAIASNLSDLNNAATSRTNLGLGTIATLSSPLPVANGGTNATAAGATAANNIGALAESSNLSDLGSASTARTNLGLSALATASSPLGVANGGTGSSSAGATAANNIGALAIASNLSDLNNAATARTNLGLTVIATASSPLSVGNGGTAHTTAGAAAANAIGAAALGANSDITSLSGLTTPLSSAQGGTGTNYGPPATYIQIANNASTGPAVNELVTLTGAPSTATLAPAGTTKGIQGVCVANCTTSGNATIQTSGFVTVPFDGGTTAGDYVVASSTTNGYFHDAGATQSTTSANIGTVYTTNVSSGNYQIQLGLPTDSVGSGGSGNNPPVQAGNTGYYNATTATVSGIGSEINIRSYLTSNPSDPLQAALSACPQIAWTASTLETAGNTITDTNGDTEYVVTGGNTKSGAHPTWPPSAIGNVGLQTTDNQVTWEMIALGGYAPSGPCTVIGNSGDIYPIPNAVILSTGSIPVYLVDHGADYNCTETGGAGHACIVEGGLGHIAGNGQGSASDNVGIANNSGTNLDSDVEGLSGYLDRLTTHPITNFKQTSFDIRNIDILPGGTAINKAALWIPSIEGQGRASQMYVGGGGPTGITDVLVDDTVQSWNGIQLTDLWIGMAAAATGVDVECGTNGGAGFIFTGWVVDPSQNNSTWIKVNGSNSANCVNGHIIAPYLEGKAGTGGTEILFNDAQAWTVTAMECLSGTETNCVKITGLEADLKVDGFNGNATNAVNDTNYNFTNTSQGSFVYAPPVNGATLLSNNNPVSSTSNITMNPLINKYTISGNATFTFAQAAGGNDGFFATATAPVTFGFEVCQGTGGNFTETFNNPSGGTLYWNGGGQPGYTLTQGNGDFYSCNYNGTNVYCRQTVSNVLCE